VKLRASLLAAVLVFITTSALAELPGDLKSASESADGVIIGYCKTFGTGGRPFMDFLVLEVLKGPDPGEKLGVALMRESLSGIDILKLFTSHGHIYIVPYRGPANEDGRYTYAGPRFDSKEIIATPENAAIVKPGSTLFEIPSFEEAVAGADIIVLARYLKYDPDTDLTRIYFQGVSILKGSLPERDITVFLGGKYLYWFTISIPDMQEKLNPLRTHEPRILLLKKEKQKLYYAGPEFTSPYLPATPENVAEVRRLLEAVREETPRKSEFDWTWWIAGAIAAVVAFFAAMLVSKVDYKHDRRRERLEKLRDSSNPDTDSGEQSS